MKKYIIVIVLVLFFLSSCDKEEIKPEIKKHSTTMIEDHTCNSCHY